MKICEVPCVGQGIQIHNPPVLHLFENITNEVRSNESGTSGDQDISYAHDRVLLVRESEISNTMEESMVHSLAKIKGSIFKIFCTKTMYKNKKIVVVMPAYNAAQTLRKTYDEVMEQGVVDLVIVVDDGSKDETAAIAKC